MLTIILFAIGFFITGGALGANIIGGFEVVQYLLWFVVVIATILSGFIFIASVIGMSVLGSDSFKSNKLLGGVAGMLGGGVLGTVLSLVILVTSYFQLWLSYYIVENVNPTVVSFGELPQNTQYAIIIFFVIVIAEILKPKNTSKD